MSNGHTPGSIATEELHGKLLRLLKKSLLPRWLIKVINQHEHTFSFLPRRPQTAASGKEVKGGFGRAKGFARPLAKPLTYLERWLPLPLRKECQLNCQIKY